MLYLDDDIRIIEVISIFSKSPVLKGFCANFETIYNIDFYRSKTIKLHHIILKIETLKKFITKLIGHDYFLVSNCYFCINSNYFCM